VRMLTVGIVVGMAALILLALIDDGQLRVRRV